MNRKQKIQNQMDQNDHLNTNDHRDRSPRSITLNFRKFLKIIKEKYALLHFSTQKCAVEGGINWDWFITYKTKGNKAKLISHWRAHKPNKTIGMTSYSLIENDKRTVIGAYIGRNKYKVVNPKYIFSYHG